MQHFCFNSSLSAPFTKQLMSFPQLASSTLSLSFPGNVTAATISNHLTSGIFISITTIPLTLLSLLTIPPSHLIHSALTSCDINTDLTQPLPQSYFQHYHSFVIVYICHHPFLFLVYYFMLLVLNGVIL